MSDNRITPGFWRTRSGLKAEIYAIRSEPTSHPVHGCVFSHNSVSVHAWTMEGWYLESRESFIFDLISPWEDNAEIWKYLPECAQWVAMNEDGAWGWYVSKPEIERGKWVVEFENCGFIQNPLAPKFTGSWKDSLTERPKP